MLDFLSVRTRSPKKGVIEVYPAYRVRDSEDLMIRGGNFYAIWNEDAKLWSTKKGVAIELIDREIDKVANGFKDLSGDLIISHLGDSESRRVRDWNMYVQKDMWDNYVPLDEKIIFSDAETTKTDYASKKLPYTMHKGECPCWDELIGTLYSDEERAKIEWAIGSIITGDSKTLQKFIVMYGDRGTGKSTIINIIQKLFEGYWVTFDAKALGSSNSAFALEPFSANPLIAIQHDGDLSRIDDNTRLNSIVSHEPMVINEKFKSTYMAQMHSFLIMGTNKPVRITDSKSGLLRRLIDVTPTGTTIPAGRYLELTRDVQYELGAIAYRCKEVYLKMGKHYYDKYCPSTMLGETNDFYNFMEEYCDTFAAQDGVTSKAAWGLYKEYCEYANVQYPYSWKVFRSEIKNYFNEFHERWTLEDGTRVRSYYKGLKKEKFDYNLKKDETVSADEVSRDWLEFGDYESEFDKQFWQCPAQYANKLDKPLKAWVDVDTVLGDIKTYLTHYVRPPSFLIVIDFDIRDPETGEKSLELNLEAANQWPRTYAELSKSGQGIHLHYIYEGDVEELSRIYAKDIEIKVFTGSAPLRRKLTKCNTYPIATISSGLPKREVRKTVEKGVIENERHLKNKINMALKKKVAPGKTVTCITYIRDTLDQAYNMGMHYDLTSMKPDVLALALGSTNNAEYCVEQVGEMKFCSEEVSEPVDSSKDIIVFYDVEVFPNLLVIVWKAQGDHKPVVMINPKPAEVEGLLDFKLIGFNNRKYDNHILYAAMMGYNNKQLYKLSKRIINNDSKDEVTSAFFREAYNLSHADIYDFAATKQSLKKWEIELGIHHEELGLPWDKEVPKELWPKVAEYCIYDVLATEAVFNECYPDYIARKMLAELSGLKINDTSRSHSTKIIFGSNKNPRLVYTDLSKMFPGYVFNPKAKKDEKSFYRGEYAKEGGYVYSEPGIYTNVALLDVSSMHPTSIILLNLFGDYTQNFKDILDARLAIKHRDFDTARKLCNGAFAKYLDDEEQADALAYALKIIINSVYGYTSASFPNPFRDPRNIDNIVAKRGALFMIDLKNAVQEKGFTVCHVKTDSIKIPDATPEIISFVTEFGKKYGYTFEHEATYERMCLVNKAEYIARYATIEDCERLYGYVPSDCRKYSGEWTATGKQFQIPYIFKSLFSHEPLVFDDYCETKQVKTAIYLDMNEGYPDVAIFEALKDARETSKPTRKQKNLLELYSSLTDEDVEDEIAKGHNYVFVGRVGRFCPMKEGCGAGELLRDNGNGFSAVTGSKGYKWMESEMVQNLKLEKYIDESYYISLLDEAICNISEFGDVEWFLSVDEPIEEAA